MPAKVTVCHHPLLQETLARLRDRKTPSSEFRKLMEDAGVHLGLEALKDLKTKRKTVRTPLKSFKAPRVEEPIVLTAILRAGLGIIPGLSRFIPSAKIGCIGLYRNEDTLMPVRYYVRLPKGLRRSRVLLMDPMLATGGSASASISILKEEGAKKITLVCLLATRAGIRRVQKDHKDVPIITAAIDPVLNSIGYIVPGLGDAGDRLYDT
jgi:uracil phosphoribosyltransferase